jgi:hypothetical protein
VRGGSWNNNQNNARAAYRNNNHPANRNNNNGFRVVAFRKRASPLNMGAFHRVSGLSGCSSRLLDREPGSTSPRVAASS